MNLLALLKMKRRKIKFWGNLMGGMKGIKMEQIEGKKR
jgi:hypothetical protein